MAHASKYDGIAFIEGNVVCDEKGKVEYKKATTINSQIKGLDAVMKQLADKAKKLGANAVICFEYGQKSQNWFKSILTPFGDDVKWHGKGIAAVISQDEYERIK